MHELTGGKVHHDLDWQESGCVLLIPEASRAKSSPLGLQGIALLFVIHARTLNVTMRDRQLEFSAVQPGMRT
jgi:hypothetical protein